MSFFKRKGSYAGILIAVCMLLCAASFSFAQKVPITFNDYHGYTGTVEYLKQVNKAYSGITELIEIGKSNMGRSVFVLVISNMRTGTTIDAHVELRNMRKENVQNVTPMKKYQGKPGQWIDGGTHGNEYTGTEVCLYIIDKLVSGYGKDEEITKLVDDKTFYICPIVNPDGVFNSVEREISQRQNSMMIDNDNDGKINEDGPDDMNGDGHITNFRYKDPEGRYVIDDVDPRIMIRLGREEETSKQRYSIVREDKDNDGDGEIGEDPERGIDVNRNFPEGWFRDDNSKGGSGYYAASSVEAHNILEFFTNHTNILLVQSFHTSGGFTYRPYARWPDSRINAKDLAIFDRVMGKRYLEIIGDEENIPDAWKESARPERAQFGAGMRGARRQQQPQQQRNRQAQAGGQRATGTGGRGYDLPRSWRHPYNDQQNRPYGYGIFIDWAFAQFGAYSMTTELWNRNRDFKGIPTFAEDDEDRSLKIERAVLKMQDEQFGGEFFVPWTKYKHPEHGDGEVGGWISKYWGGNAFPGESLIGVCENHWQFELFKAGLLPQVRITDATATALYSNSSARHATVVQDGDNVTIQRGSVKGNYTIVEVTVNIENSGKIATHTATGSSLAGNRQDVVRLIGDPDKIIFLQGTASQRLGVLEGTMEIPGYQAPAAGAARGQAGAQRRVMGMPPGIPPQMMRQFRGQQMTAEAPQTGNTREIKWLIAVEGNTPLKVVVSSQKGGTDVRELRIQ